MAADGVGEPEFLVEWFAGHSATYLERDLRQLLAISFSLLVGTGPNRKHL